jgi:hypothetical protein
MPSCICNHFLFKNFPSCASCVISPFMCQHFLFKKFPVICAFTFQKCVPYSLSFNREHIAFSTFLHFKILILNNTILLLSFILQWCIYRSLPPFLFRTKAEITRDTRTGCWNEGHELCSSFCTPPFEKSRVCFSNHITVTCLYPHQNRLTQFSCLPAIMYWHVNIRPFRSLSIGFSS